MITKPGDGPHWVKKSSLLHHFKTAEGNELEMIATKSIQCPSCLTMLNVVVSQDNSDYYYIYQCYGCRDKENK